jgi:4-hydroxy-tetrahydrodipicolinate synthase
MLVAHISRRIDGRCQIIASAGSNSTDEALSLSNAIEGELGPTTFLHVTGYYNNPPQAGLRAHFLALADGLKFPQSNIIIYNVPSRTGSNMEAATTIELARHSRIAGIKESSGNLAQVKEIIEHTDAATFRVLTGECNQIEQTIAMGGFGAISATANLAPRLFVDMARAALKGEVERARDLQEKAMPAVQAVFAAKNPIPLAMLFGSHLRLPLVALPDLQPRLKDLLAGYSTTDLGIDLAGYAA